MNKSEVLDEFRAARALLEGHFVLSSGLHSSIFLQGARVMMDAARNAQLCGALAAKVPAHASDQLPEWLAAVPMTNPGSRGMV